MDQQLPLIQREVSGEVVPQRPTDGYINATILCQRAGKLFGHYHESARTKAFLEALSADIGIPISGLVQVRRGGNNKLEQGTWVHPQVAISLGQWLSAEFEVQVTKWVLEWREGHVQGYMPVHVARYMKNRAKIDPSMYFSMLNEVYLHFLAPLEDCGIIPPEDLMPDISTGRMFSDYLRSRGIDPTEFPYYWHEFTDHRPTVRARLYPLKYLEDFRQYFYETWLPTRLESYLKDRIPKALPFLRQIQSQALGQALPSPSAQTPSTRG